MPESTGIESYSDVVHVWRQFLLNGPGHRANDRSPVVFRRTSSHEDQVDAAVRHDPMPPRQGCDSAALEHPIIADIRLQPQARTTPLKLDGSRLHQVIRFFVTHNGYSTIFQKPRGVWKIPQSLFFLRLGSCAFRVFSVSLDICKKIE